MVQRFFRNLIETPAILIIQINVSSDNTVGIIRLRNAFFGIMPQRTELPFKKENSSA